MEQRFCQECGTAAEPVAAYCAACSARLAAPPGSPAAAVAPAEAPEQVPDHRPSAPREPTLPWSVRRIAGILGVATVVAVIALLGGALALDRLVPLAGRPPGSPAPDTPPAAIVMSSTAPYVAGDTPEEAVGAFLGFRGLSFAGVCSAADPLVETGSYCTELVDERPGLQVHWIGRVGSEPDTWLLVEAGQLGWVVTTWEPVRGPADAPPF